MADQDGDSDVSHELDLDERQSRKRRKIRNISNSRSRSWDDSCGEDSDYARTEFEARARSRVRSSDNLQRKSTRDQGRQEREHYIPRDLGEHQLTMYKELAQYFKDSFRTKIVMKETERYKIISKVVYTYTYTNEERIFEVDYASEKGSFTPELEREVKDITDSQWYKSVEDIMSGLESLVWTKTHEKWFLQFPRRSSGSGNILRKAFQYDMTSDYGRHGVSTLLLGLKDLVDKEVEVMNVGNTSRYAPSAIPVEIETHPTYDREISQETMKRLTIVQPDVYLFKEDEINMTRKIYLVVEIKKGGRLIEQDVMQLTTLSLALMGQQK